MLLQSLTLLTSVVIMLYYIALLMLIEKSCFYCSESNVSCVRMFLIVLYCITMYNV